jgi:WYL domain
MLREPSGGPVQDAEDAGNECRGSRRLRPQGNFGNAWSVYRGEQSHVVEVVFAKEAAATVTEGVWHHTQKVRKNKDGSVTLTFQVDGLNEILRWILGWGHRAKVIQPPELRELIAAWPSSSRPRRRRSFIRATSAITVASPA